MQVVYGLIEDMGDSSFSLKWFKNEALVEDLLENNEWFSTNEGSPSETLTFPDDLDLSTCGFDFYDEEY